MLPALPESQKICPDRPPERSLRAAPQLTTLRHKQQPTPRSIQLQQEKLVVTANIYMCINTVEEGHKIVLHHVHVVLIKINKILRNKLICLFPRGNDGNDDVIKQFFINRNMSLVGFICEFGRCVTYGILVQIKQDAVDDRIFVQLDVFCQRCAILKSSLGSTVIFIGVVRIVCSAYERLKALLSIFSVHVEGVKLGVEAWRRNVIG